MFQVIKLQVETSQSLIFACKLVFCQGLSVKDVRSLRGEGLSIVDILRTKVLQTGRPKFLLRKT